MALGHGEKRWGEAAAAETALVRALELQPDNVEGLVLMAELARQRALEAHEESEQAQHWEVAREFLRRAIEADPADHQVHAAQARFRRYSPGWTPGAAP